MPTSNGNTYEIVHAGHQIRDHFFAGSRYTPTETNESFDCVISLCWFLFEQTFGLGCLANACTSNLMTNLFTITGSTTVPTLPPPFAFPTSTVSAQGAGEQAAAVSLSGVTGWTQVPSANFGN